MANYEYYVNVLDWDPSTVVEWLNGLELEPSVSKNYCESFRNNNINGQRLLHLTVSDLIKLNVEKLGHQEIVLEGLEKLKNFHYNLSTENLQFIALKLSCKARSLYNEICILESKHGGVGPNGSSLISSSSSSRQKVDTLTMSAVADVLDALMTMLSWLNKPPFGAQMISATTENNSYSVFSQCYVSLGIELATNAQRDAFAENPVETIQKCCLKLADYSDQLIRDSIPSEDPLILQPASLEIVTVKKRPGEDDFGLEIDPVHHPGVHVIHNVKWDSLAAKCGRIAPGDEIVQINYQTVVGWSTKKLMEAINQENLTDLVLTLKKIPKNLAGCGRILPRIQPVPIKKPEIATIALTQAPASKVVPEIVMNAPSNELYVQPADISFSVKPKRNSLPEVQRSSSSISTKIDSSQIEDQDMPDEEDDTDDYLDDIDAEVYLPTTSSTKDISPTQSVRSLLLRPRSTPIRRATISAGSPSKHQPYINVSEIWAGMFDTAKSNKSNNSDGNSKHSSATSTMQSNDSGCATMYSSSMLCNNQDYVSKSPPRPVTIGPEYINMADDSQKEYINLFACKTSNLIASKRQPPPPPPPPKQPIPKPRLNVSLSTSSTEETRKKRPVPQPRSIASKSTSTSKLIGISSAVQPVPSVNVKIFKRHPSRSSVSSLDPPLPSVPPPPPPVPNAGLQEGYTSSSSSGEEGDGPPPVLPARGASQKSVPYYMSDVQENLK